MPIKQSTADAPWWRDLALLAVALGVLYGMLLGSRPLSNPDEGRYAEIPREMLATGDWVTPRLDGVNYFEKPPLGYWATAASEEIFGLNEWAVRAVPALFAAAGVLLTYAAARRLSGRTTGLAAAAVLGTSVLWFAGGHIVTLDMAVSVLMSATLFCFILGVREPPGARRRWLFYGLYASAALATLTKGLIGFLVTGAIMFGWLLVFNQWKRLRPLHLPTGAALFLVIAAPWHVLAALRNPTWFHRYIVYEHFQRFFAEIPTGHLEPWWYFIPIAVLGLFPWAGFLGLAGRGLFRGGWARRGENADRWFFVCWAGFILLFFSASHSKLALYILPLFPAMAVLIGAGVAQTLEVADAAKRLRAGLYGFAFLCGLLAVGAVGIVVLQPPWAKLTVAQALALRPPALLLAAILVLGGTLAPALARMRGARTALGGVVATMTLFYGTLLWAAPAIQNLKPGTEELAHYVATHAHPSDEVVNYHDFFHDFTFYAGRTVDVVAGNGELEVGEDAAAQASGRFMDDAAFRRRWAQPGRVYVVARKRDTAALFADPTFQKYLLAETEDHCLFSNQP